MKKILFLVLLMFITISAVSAAENISDVSIEDCVNVELPQDDFTLANDSGDSVPAENDLNDSNSSAEDSNKIDEKITIKGENLVWYYNAKPVYKFKIVDSNGTGLAVENVSVTLNKVNTPVNTDKDGIGTLPINLKAGNYKVTVKYGNESLTNTVKLFSSRISHSKDISTKYGTKANYYVKLVNNSNAPMKGVAVTFKVGKNTYTRKTDSNGKATLSLNYNSGKYTIKYSVEGFSGSNKYTVKNKVTLTILKWGLTGDVTKQPLIKNNMPNNYWVKKAVAATKKGLPLLTIKGGKGKVVFMTAGVHGNELNSQVAAMKMIKYLTTHSIKGTVYIIPFVNVKAISKHVRLTNYDFNRVAHVSGTVSNKIINLIIKKKCDAYGDFHTTVSPGVPGINVVLGYTSPNKCVPMTKYIAKNAKVNKIFYYPGQKYRWSLADYANLKGVPAVICEVISPVNHVSAKATNLSYKQMTCYLKYNSII